MAGNIARRPDGRWRARYRDAEHREHARHFGTRREAQVWLDEVTTAVRSGLYVDPNMGRITVGDWSARWLDGQAHLKPSTHERYAGILREHVVPRWGGVRLVEVSHTEVQAWVTRLAVQLSPATVRKVHRVLSMILKTAVKDSRLSRNVADGVNLPRVAAGEHRYLTHDQVRELAWRCGRFSLVVEFLAYTGLRFGEMAALRVGRLDLTRRRVLIAESVTLIGGVQTWGTPKGHARREVAIPRFLVAELALQIAGKGPLDLVFTGDRGGALRAHVFRNTALTRAAVELGVPGLHPHELRHTAASLAIASGAPVKVVQQMLGHKTATMTLDLYGHLYGDQLDEVGDRMDQAARAVRRTDADYLRTNGDMILSSLNRPDSEGP